MIEDEPPPGQAEKHAHTRKTSFVIKGKGPYFSLFYPEMLRHHKL